ncbi:zinc carboxypeptidase, partial [Ostertagia ostertagi]
RSGHAANIVHFQIGGHDRSKRIFWIDGGIHAREWAAPHTALYFIHQRSGHAANIVHFQIGGHDRSKRIFWIDGGIHAREWAAPHTALYFIHQLTSRYDTDPTIKSLLEEITFVIVPCVNPDGYEFTRSSTNPHIRLWRKNRSQMQCRKDSWGRNRCCRGVDLNRNFDFHFKGRYVMRSCQGAIEAVSTLSLPFILTHRFGSILTVTEKTAILVISRNWYDVGKKAARALEKVYGTKYVVGSGADTLYPASGGSEDWAKHAGGVKYVYLLELRPDEKNWDGFILGESELVPTARETWEGVKVVASAVLDRVRRKMPPEQRNDSRLWRVAPNSCYRLCHACKALGVSNDQFVPLGPDIMRENRAIQVAMLYNGEAIGPRKGVAPLLKH